ncbi:Uncharacterised protein [Mycobacteroides abscessus subsp. abscessus]|nr:Uncharacterised protein [Mycobacteroides abscessus subsp. abscessus]
MPLRKRCGTQRARKFPCSSRYCSVWPPHPTMKLRSGLPISQGFPLSSQLSVFSTCHPSRISWSKIPYS